MQDFHVKFKGRDDLDSKSLTNYREIEVGRVYEMQDAGRWRLVEIQPGENGEPDLLIFEPERDESAKRLPESIKGGLLRPDLKADAREVASPAKIRNEREVERIVAVYREYEPTVSARYDSRNRGNQIIIAELDVRMARLLRKHGLFPLRERTILDVGCGNGYVLGLLKQVGATPVNLHGIDLLPERIEIARAKHPGIAFQVGNAEKLPYEDSSFNLVLLFTLLTSVLDQKMRANIAAEVARVLQPGGWILWYDFRYNNPRNKNVRGIGRRDLKRLFPDFACFPESITLLPPLARRLGPATSLLYPPLSTIRPLRTHYLGLLRRRGAEGREALPSS